MRRMDGRDYYALKGVRKGEMPCGVGLPGYVWDLGTRGAAGSPVDSVMMALDRAGWR